MFRRIQKVLDSCVLESIDYELCPSGVPRLFARRGGARRFSPMFVRTRGVQVVDTRCYTVQAATMRLRFARVSGSRLPAFLRPKRSSLQVARLGS